jgi:hypothetical protein
MSSRSYNLSSLMQCRQAMRLPKIYLLTAKLQAILRGSSSRTHKFLPCYITDIIADITCRDELACEERWSCGRCDHPLLSKLYFHPLAKCPGPWLAAASYLLEFYYDVIKAGRHFAVIVKMHEQYGT